MLGSIDGDKQKLVDICFSCVILTHMERKSFEKMTREEIAEWTARQLRECGFDTSPCGASWGVLKNIDSR